jgi:hypothetical protein
MIRSSSQNTVGVQQITFLTLYCTGFWLVTLLKVIDAPLNYLVFFVLLFVLSLYTSI